MDTNNLPNFEDMTPPDELDPTQAQFKQDDPEAATLRGFIAALPELLTFDQAEDIASHFGRSDREIRSALKEDKIEGAKKEGDAANSPWSIPKAAFVTWCESQVEGTTLSTPPEFSESTNESQKMKNATVNVDEAVREQGSTNGIGLGCQVSSRGDNRPKDWRD